MKTRSLWQDTKTFFPLFLTELTRRQVETVCVVGASDGKFVIQLAQRGYRVLAIERDPLAVHGGPVTLPGHVPGHMLGLEQRAKIENVADRVEIIARDVFDTHNVPACDAVWTSCSWHYSINHTRPLREFIDRMKALCAPAGLLGAEYMMPVEKRHLQLEHYLENGQIRDYFVRWRLHWEAYTPAFVEDPHVEQLGPHRHRMGFITASRATTS